MGQINNQDLGTVTSEKITKSQPILVLPTVTGDTNSTQLASLLGCSRRISASGFKVFSSTSARDTWIQSVDGLITALNIISVPYVPSSITQTYSSPPATTYQVLIDTFEFWIMEGQPPTTLYWSLELIEGSGVGGTS